MHSDIKNIIEILKGGGTIIYPTDSVWGLGCDATQKEAVDKIFSLKKREGNNPLLMLLYNENQLFDYVKEVPDIAFDLFELSEEPLTIVFEKGKNVAENVLGADGSIAIRICKSDSCGELLKRWRKPLVSTSVNISGAPFAHGIEDMDPAITQHVDAIYKSDYIIENANPSKIIKLKMDGSFSIIRK